MNFHGENISLWLLKPQLFHYDYFPIMSPFLVRGSAPHFYVSPSIYIYMLRYSCEIALWFSCFSPVPGMLSCTFGVTMNTAWTSWTPALQSWRPPIPPV